MAARNPELSCEGFSCFAGPYSASEEHMILPVLLDAAKANKETRVDRNGSVAWIWQRSRTRNAA